MRHYNDLKDEIKEQGNSYFVVPEWNMKDLTKKIKRQGKRAVELGCVPARIEILDTVETYYDRYTGRRDDRGHEVIEKVVFDVSILRIVGEAPKLAGWTFAAKISVGDDEGAGNIIYRVPGFEGEIPQSFRTADPKRCDHCETQRRRSDVFILQHEDGTWKQVGRTCLADFLGHVNPEGYAKYAETLASLSAIGGDIEGDKGFTSYLEDPKREMLSFLTVVAGIVKVKGWMSKSSANKINSALDPNDYEARRAVPTSEHVHYYFSNPLSADAARDHRRFVEQIDDATGDAEAKLAEAALNWARALPETTSSDYLWNLRVLATQNSVASKNFAFAASLISSYQRTVAKDEEKKAEREAKPESEWFGEVKKREVFTLKVVFTKWIESYYGESTLVKFEDADGNAAMWFASNCPDEIEKGATVKVKATVKAHESYKGQKQTKLTRVAVLEVIEDVPEETPERPTDIAVEKREKSEKQEIADAHNAIVRERNEILESLTERIDERTRLALQAPGSDEVGEMTEQIDDLSRALAILAGYIQAGIQVFSKRGFSVDEQTGEVTPKL